MSINPIGSSSIWLFDDAPRRVGLGGDRGEPGPLAKLFGVKDSGPAPADPLASSDGPLAQLFALAPQVAAPPPGLSREEASDPNALLNFLANLGKQTPVNNLFAGPTSPEQDPLGASTRILSGFFGPQQELIEDVIFTLDQLG